MKKLISMLLCFVMVLSMLGTITALAEATEDFYHDSCGTGGTNDYYNRRSSTHHESWYYRFRITGTDSGTYTWFAQTNHYISLRAGVEYKMTARIQIESPAADISEALVRAYFVTDNDETVTSAAFYIPTAESKYCDVEYTLTPKTDGEVKLRWAVSSAHTKGTSTYIRFDDIKIVEPGAEGDDGDQSMTGLVTRDVYSDNCDSVEAFQAVRSILSADSGAAKFALTQDTTGTSRNRIFNIPVGPALRIGGEYKISFKSKASVEGLQIYIGIITANGEYFIRKDMGDTTGRTGGTLAPQLTTEWTEYSFTTSVDKFVTSKTDITPIDLTEAGTYFYVEAYASNKGDVIWMDDVIVTETIDKSKVFAYPVVESIEVTGVARVGQKLTANAVVTDSNKDDTPFAAYQWQYLDGDSWKDISEKNEKEYTIEEAYLGKQLRVAVTPMSDNEPLKGTVVYSEATEAVQSYTYPPSGKGASVSGDFSIGGKLTATYEYVPSESSIPEGNSIFVWEISASEDGEYTPVQASVNNEYVTEISDVGMWIRVCIIPKDTNGIEGAGIYSEATLVSGSAEIFVSANGSDDNTGTIDSPFKTIEKARDAVRSIKSKPQGGIVVNVRGGVYPVSKTIEFTAEDSGTKDCPVIYKAYNDEKVSFIGGKTIDTSKIQKVTDSKILDRMNVPEAKNNLYMLDLSEQGIEMNALEPYGWRDNNYRPMRIYMNNTVLSEARWPNDNDSEMFVKARPLTNKDDGIDEDKFNTDNTPIMYEYPDPENRSANWTVNKGDTYIGGAIVQMWNSQNLLIDTIDVDKKVVTSLSPMKGTSAVKGVGYGPVYAVYFSNIPEEIDKPGESYVDRLGVFGKKDVLYFYPVGALDGEMVVSTLKEKMISVIGAEYITFSGINFKDTIETPIQVNKSNNIRIENAEIANSSRGAVSMVKTTNSVVSGCNIYSTGENPIYIECDEAGMAELIPTGNIIENNNIHNVVLLPHSRISRAAVWLYYSVGDIIRNNEFNDLPFGALDMATVVDVKFENNRVLNSVQINSDGGAVYWGRQFNNLGNVVRNNYFENIGSKYVTNKFKSDGVGSFFADDAATSGNIYGNVIYNGGTGQAAMFTNGAEFGNMQNNICITDDAGRLDSSLNHRAWSSTVVLRNVYGFNYGKYPNVSFSTWLYIMGMRDAYGSNSHTFNKQYSEYFATDVWKEHYKGTQWEGAINIYNKDFYDGAKALYDKEDYKGVLQYLADNIPNKITNNIHNNAVFGVTTMESRANHYDNFIGTEGMITDAEKAMFVDFDNKDFTLTTEGLAIIQKKAPGFEAIPFNEIGLTTNVGGNKPVIKINTDDISAIAAPGEVINASYNFTDADGDLEGNTRVYWYVAKKADGNFEKIYNVEGKTFKIPEGYSGKYIKYEVVPYDVTVLRGESVMSDAMFVKLQSPTADARIAEIETELGKAVAGIEPGNYPESAISTLKTAVEVAKTAVSTAKTETDIEDAMKVLEREFTVFKNKVVKDTTSDEEDGSDDEPTTPSAPSYPSGGGGGGGGGGSSSGGNKVTYDGSANNVQSVKPSTPETPTIPSTSDKFVFDDVKGHWSEADVMAMFEAGIVSGVSETTFEPDRSITRAEFATLVVKALGLDEGEADFEDVNDEWFAPFVGAAAKAGIIAGSDGKFRPNDTITRQEMAVIVVKAYEHLEKSADSAELAFSDNEIIADWAKEYVSKAVGAGLISGMGDDMFAPSESATRAQAASVVSRIIK